jgi:aspartokinase-like uncharacterized kinase
MNRRAVRVVKVGGSLFDFSRLPEALRAWLRTQEPAANVLIAGGGRWADVIRDADARFALGDEASHWLCVDILGSSARLLAALLRESRLVTSLRGLRRVLSSAPERSAPEPDSAGAPCEPAAGNRRPPPGRARIEPADVAALPPIVFCPVSFLHEDEPQLDEHPLPHTWNVTTDSIAARLAETLSADELVLLKSADPPPVAGAAGEYVDNYFAQVARRLRRVRMVNLRRFAEQHLAHREEASCRGGTPRL